ncbi:SUMF1/EgtB/PvdO family nonheme iron enzyme [Flexibacter flexilis]|uniref:SUMF1/EgtB/PvdO family nonheme iron enzyme n=1 Tax=Flexibacter flexilis TaxID=998 RepID=UPI0015A646B7|nr:SUMF1/EgtB/PvdO family nonheme iron enzyme [Flexibacter flexilis]
MVQCQISWENSWLSAVGQTPDNHDAVWVFVKVKGTDGIWRHLDLAQNHLVTGNLQIQNVSDHKGIFVRRNAAGEGLSQGSISLQIADNQLTAGNYQLKIFGIEMAYVPQSAFWVGDTLSNNTLRSGAKNTPFQISSENAISIGSTAQSLYGNTDNQPQGEAIAATFPKGFAGFYAMKYEITQEQYADFLNSLTSMQQTARTAVSPSLSAGTNALGSGNMARNGLIIATPATSTQAAIYACNANNNTVYNEADDGQNRACNWLNWNDLAAYLDWAALRPMTELEFEKAARGTTYPAPRDMAWGTNLVTDANTTAQDGTAAESVTETVTGDYGLSNHALAFGQTYLWGVLRVGFGATAASNRLSAGASQYGLMELSGNVWETCVSVSKTEGLLFEGTHGDGALSEAGEANANTWPTPNGAINRGGGWNSLVYNTLTYQFRDLAVSDRFYANTAPSARRNTSGGRGVRTF